MTMKLQQILISALGGMIVFACGPSKNLSLQQRAEGDALFAQGNYAAALEKYKLLNLETHTFDSTLFRNVAVSAYKTADYNMACQYGTKVKHNSDNELTFILYESQDSVGQPDNAVFLIEENQPIFEEKYGKQTILTRLANHYIDHKDAKIADIYTQAETPELRSLCFDHYFKQIKDSTAEKDLMAICRKALKDNPDQIKAIDYIAVSLYNTGESRYNAVMSEYNKNKNATTYAYLRRDLKRITPFYTEAKTHFEHLRKLAPDEKNYIKYLINIYNRLDQGDKSKALRKLL
ncbi:MAG: hypothetical protein J6Y82_04670 [Bacteroidales bacterium]|nr:hypothetical protein [Bacteroidales bacterium]